MRTKEIINTNKNVLVIKLFSFPDTHYLHIIPICKLHLIKRQLGIYQCQLIQFRLFRVTLMNFELFACSTIYQLQALDWMEYFLEKLLPRLFGKLI